MTIKEIAKMCNVSISTVSNVIMISMVIVSYLVFGFLSTGNGFLNNSILKPLGMEPVAWYMEKKYWPFIFVMVNAWKVIGYNCVIYLAAILGIDRSIYESWRY